MALLSQPCATNSTIRCSHEVRAESAAKRAWIAEEGAALPLPEDYLLHNRWSSYPILCTAGVLVATTMAAFNRTEVRRRNLSSPASSMRLGLSLAAASMVALVVAWVCFACLGLVAFGGSLEGTDGWRLALCCCSPSRLPWVACA